jgi:hypothetical protein
MKDCNATLAAALCQALSTPDMAVYHYLTNLDFFKDASGCNIHFGRIPQAEVRFPHLQLFPKLEAELFKVGRLLGTSSDARYAIFTSPEIHLGMVHYTTVVDPWFHTAAAYNFATAAALLDWLQAGTRIAFIQKARQSPDTPRNLKEQFLKCYQAICADQQLNPTPMTMARLRLMLINKSSVRGKGARRGGGPPIRTASDQPCLWCAQKGHTIFDCPSPPTPALK